MNPWIPHPVHSIIRSDGITLSRDDFSINIPTSVVHTWIILLGYCGANWGTYSGSSYTHIFTVCRALITDTREKHFFIFVGPLTWPRGTRSPYLACGLLCQRLRSTSNQAVAALILSTETRNTSYEMGFPDSSRWTETAMKTGIWSS